MAYSDEVADRVRHALTDARAVFDEREMFGGLAFMVRGNMTVGIRDEQLMVRVGREAYDDALAQAHAHPMDFTGRPLTGYVYVAPAGFADDDALAGWVTRALDFNATLPPK